MNRYKILLAIEDKQVEIKAKDDEDFINQLNYFYEISGCSRKSEMKCLENKLIEEI